MKIVIRKTENEIPIESLKDKTVASLFEKIEEVCDCKGKIISIYTPEKKISIGDGSTLEDFGITDDTRILVLLKKGETTTKKVETTANSANMGDNNQNGSMNPNMNMNGGMNPMANGMGGMNPMANGSMNPMANGMGGMNSGMYGNMGGMNPNMNGNPYMGGNQFGNMSGSFPGMMGGNDPMNSPINDSVLQNLFNNSQTFDMAIESVFPGASPEQKKRYKDEIQNLRDSNPQQWNTLLNNASNMANNKHAMGGMNPMANGMGGMNPMANGMGGMNGSMANGMGGMNGSMGNGMGASPMMPYANNMNSPMNNRMNPMYNPLMQQAMLNRNNIPAPTDGSPCSHGFYPPVIVDGKAQGQNADILFLNEIKELDSMGFNDKELNKTLLVKHSGSIHHVVEELINRSAKNDKK